MSAFNRSDRLPIELPDLLTDLAAPRIPDYVDDVLAVTAATRQRPRWTFPERWLPMSAISSERVGAPPVPWRFLVAMALVIVLVALAVAFAGAQHRTPLPFGPAANGAIVFGDGDIQIRDSVDGIARPIFGGPTDDFAANFTRDGTHLIWLRRVSGSSNTPSERIAFVVANADGSNVRQVSDGLQAPDWWDLSPDGRSVVVEVGDPDIGKKLFTVDLVGNGGRQPLDVHDPQMTMSTPNFLGPTGDEITFRGRTTVAGRVVGGIFAVHPDGSGLRKLTPTDGETGAFYQMPLASEDGRYLTYTDWEQARERNSIHVIDLQTGIDRLLDPGTARNEGYASFSPDGRYLAFGVVEGPLNTVWLEPANGSEPARQVGPAYRVGDGYLNLRFSPDARSILLVDEPSKETRLVDVDRGGDGRVIDWTPSDTRSWQRLAL